MSLVELPKLLARILGQIEKLDNDKKTYQKSYNELIKKRRKMVRIIAEAIDANSLEMLMSRLGPAWDEELQSYNREPKGPLFEMSDDETE